MKSASPQHSPLALRDAAGTLRAVLKIDAADFAGGALTLKGWSHGALGLEVLAAGRALACDVERGRRPDVAQALGIPEPAPGFGFTLTARAGRGAGDFALRSTVADAAGAHGHAMVHPLQVLSGEAADGVTAHALAALVAVDAAAASAQDAQACVVGWAVHDEDTRLLLLGDASEVPLLDRAYRFHRPDVYALHGGGFADRAVDAGFIARIPGVRPGDVLRLVARRHGVERELQSLAFAALPEQPVAAARWLFGARSPASEFHARVATIDAPLLEPLIARQAARWGALPVRVRTLGDPPADPAASLVVPLYGRIDFVEHQLMEFSRDAWLRAHVELVYVIDDPALVEPFALEAGTLHALYGVPMRWVQGGANRGFSGANNLGASVCRGRHLLFVNSDVFPQAPGWVAPLLEVLHRHPDIVAVGPRLVHADGSIQHAGMRFARREDLGVWINAHPGRGFDPALDPRAGLVRVPAVTGACLAVRRADFERVGGWDTGYLVGDFEDSDLCLKLRELGGDVGYLPSVELTHLERQSFRLEGGDEFRQRVVIYNAVRHQARWARRLADDARNDGAAGSEAA